VVTQRRAKLWLGVVLGLTAVAVVLATATGAGAAASFNPQARTGFISRGDVMAAGGAGALVADPLIAYQTTQTFTETCTWTNGTSVQASGSHFLFLLFQAETRYAAGSQTITGYRISPADIIDGQTSDAGEDRALCFAARGMPDDGSAITQTFSFGRLVETLTFFGPSGAVALPFHS
jgi:hypothetical protein